MCVQAGADSAQVLQLLLWSASTASRTPLVFVLPDTERATGGQEMVRDTATLADPEGQGDTPRITGRHAE